MYPYYAGFPESFVRTLLSSARLPPSSVVYDPWNGSGTTTSAASALGYASIGLDINPAMIVVAKARLFPVSEAPSLIPICKGIVERARSKAIDLAGDDPLLTWFGPSAARLLRSLERSCAALLVDRQVGWKIEQISTFAALMYTALFASARKLAAPLRSANPTWIRAPKRPADRVRISQKQLAETFTAAIESVQEHLSAKKIDTMERANCQILVADATTTIPSQKVDWILTSPPYCTRIDYAAATYIELALIQPLLEIDVEQLRSSMIGTTKVPRNDIVPAEQWGSKCNTFLRAVQSHQSKASKGYYYRTHLDYFDKMYRSLGKLAAALKPQGAAVLVAQDSYYKELHNDLPGMLIEISEAYGLSFRRRVDFQSRACMSRVNTRAAAHSTRTGSTESVLCFVKN